MSVYKYYLGHFIYVAIAIVLFVVVGEDSNTIFFGTGLAFMLSSVLYIYNFALYVLLGRVFEYSSFVCFMIAPLLLLIFFSPFKNLIEQLDFWGVNLAYLIIIVSLLVNGFTYLKLKKHEDATT